jgi:hypothetical protein
MLKVFYVHLFFIFAFANNIYAQGKFEKESRIKEDEVPAKSILFLDSLRYHTKIKWYKEEGLNDKSIEAKFKYKKSKHSVEFDTLGNIEDVEIEVKGHDVAPRIKEFMVEQLLADCLTSKIIKIQKQYTGTENDLFLFLHRGIINNGVQLNYELIVRCKNSEGINLVEYLFNDQGIILDKTKVILKNSSHLEY